MQAPLPPPYRTQKGCHTPPKAPTRQAPSPLIARAHRKQSHNSARSIHKGVDYYIFEIVIATNIRDALIRFSKVGEFNAKLSIVADESRKSEYRKSVALPAFQQIRDKCNFIPPRSLLKMYIPASHINKTHASLHTA